MSLLDRIMVVTSHIGWACVELDAEQAVLLQSDEGETIFDRPERTIRILADRDELALTWFRYEPGQEGPEPHVHRRHTDAFYVLQGELELGLGPDVTRMTGAAGTLAAAPPNVVHTFRNASSATVVFLNIHAPNMGFTEAQNTFQDDTTVDGEATAYPIAIPESFELNAEQNAELDAYLASKGSPYASVDIISSCDAAGISRSQCRLLIAITLSLT